ncbi:hypothetical protein FB45DRAFT_829824 [Roridomyces roridus]|uniref:BTB domain-containing protein n=1 Tax=Roridomyces roridus TaxID=1738132 RepID=A0AAD7BYR8_9AGAR|nr:hypothetical protein FB45DRAFT_829824 [Roridomyces roridus]
MDTTPATTGKEIRTEESTGTTTLTRSRIWKPFGDIVLQVESTQFRVNRDSLADHSTVFADMLSIPQPPSEPAVEGCPVVILSGDSARDWEAFLGFLYDPFADQEALSLEVIAAMLRLGRKYEIAAAEANAVRRIHFEFPKDLDAWDKCSAHFTKIEDYDGLPLDILKLAQFKHSRNRILLLGNALSGFYSYRNEAPRLIPHRASPGRRENAGDRLRANHRLSTHILFLVGR